MHILRRVALTILFALISSTSSAVADDSKAELLERGFETLWQGFASVTTCVHEEDAYELGPYVFVCDQNTYEYIYHYGETSLMVRPFKYKGKTFFTSYICFDDEASCVEGSVFRR
jgi:hypothetical protein